MNQLDSIINNLGDTAMKTDMALSDFFSEDFMTDAEEMVDQQLKAAVGIDPLATDDQIGKEEMLKRLNLWNILRIDDYNFPHFNTTKRNLYLIWIICSFSIYVPMLKTASLNSNSWDETPPEGINQMNDFYQSSLLIFGVVALPLMCYVIELAVYVIMALWQWFTIKLLNREIYLYYFLQRTFIPTAEVISSSFHAVLFYSLFTNNAPTVGDFTLGLEISNRTFFNLYPVLSTEVGIWNFNLYRTIIFVNLLIDVKNLVLRVISRSILMRALQKSNADLVSILIRYRFFLSCGVAWHHAFKNQNILQELYDKGTKVHPSNNIQIYHHLLEFFNISRLDDITNKEHYRNIPEEKISSNTKVKPFISIPGPPPNTMANILTIPDFLEDHNYQRMETSATFTFLAVEILAHTSINLNAQGREYVIESRQKARDIASRLFEDLKGLQNTLTQIMGAVNTKKIQSSSQNSNNSELRKLHKSLGGSESVTDKIKPSEMALLKKLDEFGGTNDEVKKEKLLRLKSLMIGLANPPANTAAQFQNEGIHAADRPSSEEWSDSNQKLGGPKEIQIIINHLDATTHGLTRFESHTSPKSAHRTIGQRIKQATQKRGSHLLPKKSPHGSSRRASFVSRTSRDKKTDAFLDTTDIEAEESESSTVDASVDDVDDSTINNQLDDLIELAHLKADMAHLEDDDSLKFILFEMILGEKHAKLAYSLMIDSGDQKAIRRKDFESTADRLYYERSSIVTRMYNQRKMLSATETMFNVILWIPIVVILLIFLGTNPTTAIVSMSGLIASMTVVLGTFHGTFMQSLLLVAFNNPFKIGDRLSLNDNRAIVQETHALHCVTAGWDDVTHYVPYTVLDQMRLLNDTPTTRAVFYNKFLVSDNTSDKKIKTLRSLCEAFVAIRPYYFVSNGFYMRVSGHQPGHYLEIETYACYRGSWHYWMRVGRSRTEFIFFVLRCCQVLRIQYSLPVQPLSIVGGPRDHHDQEDTNKMDWNAFIEDHVEFKPWNERNIVPRLHPDEPYGLNHPVYHLAYDIDVDQIRNQRRPRNVSPEYKALKQRVDTLTSIIMKLDSDNKLGSRELLSDLDIGCSEALGTEYGSLDLNDSSEDGAVHNMHDLMTRKTTMPGISTQRLRQTSVTKSFSTAHQFGLEKQSFRTTSALDLIFGEKTGNTVPGDIMSRRRSFNTRNLSLHNPHRVQSVEQKPAWPNLSETKTDDPLCYSRRSTQFTSSKLGRNDTLGTSWSNLHESKTENLLDALRNTNQDGALQSLKRVKMGYKYEN